MACISALWGVIFLKPGRTHLQSPGRSQEPCSMWHPCLHTARRVHIEGLFRYDMMIKMIHYSHLTSAEDHFHNPHHNTHWIRQIKRLWTRNPLAKCSQSWCDASLAQLLLTRGSMFWLGYGGNRGSSWSVRMCTFRGQISLSLKSFSAGKLIWPLWNVGKASE